MLCASLGWIAQQKAITQQQLNSSDEAETCNGLGVLNNPTQRKVPLIVYASRTHSQILQGVLIVLSQMKIFLNGCIFLQQCRNLNETSIVT